MTKSAAAPRTSSFCIHLNKRNACPNEVCNPPRARISNEIRLLRKIVAALREYSEIAHGLDAAEHLEQYEEWLNEALFERKSA